MNGCEGLATQVDVVIKPSPSAPIVTGLTSYCQSDVVLPLTASGTGGTISWYDNNMVLLTTGASYTPSSVTATYYVTETINGCVSDVTQVDVVIVTNPLDPTIDGSTTFCFGEVVTAVSGATSGGTYSWYDENQTLLSSGSIFTPSVTAVGTYIFYVKSMVGTCPTNFVPFNVVINEVPGIPVVSGTTTYCDGETGTALTALSTGTGLINYEWSSSNAFSTVLSTSSTYTPTLGGVGTQVYYVRATIGSCVGPVETVFILINGLPGDLMISGETTYCEGDVASALVVTSIGGIGSSSSDNLVYEWSISSDFNPIIWVGDTFIPELDFVGDRIYYVRAKGENGCYGSVKEITIHVGEIPSSPVSNDANYCFGDIIDLLTAVGNGGELTWYDAAGLELGTGNSFDCGVDNSVIGMSCFYVMESVGGCESALTEVCIELNEVPSIPTSLGDSYCEGENVSDLTVIGSGGLFNWYSDGNLINQIGVGSSFASGIDNSLPGITCYNVTETLNGCVSEAQEVCIEIKERPISPNVISPTPICSTDAFSIINFSGNGSYHWFNDVSLSVASFMGTTNSYSPPSVQHSMWVLNELNGCSSVVAKIDFDVETPPNAGEFNAIFICNDYGDPIYLIDELMGDPDQNGIWVDTRTNDPIFTGEVVVGPQMYSATTSLVFKYTVKGGEYCPDDEQLLFVTIEAKGDPGKGGQIAVCETELGVDLRGKIQDADDLGKMYDPFGDHFTGNFDPNIHSEGKYSYKIEATDVCSDTSSFLDVIITNKPDVKFEVSKAEICVGEPFDLISTEENSLVAEFRWFISSGDVFTKKNIKNHSLDEPGIYDVTLTVNNVGLEETECMETATIPAMIKVFESPIANFEAEPERVSILEGEIDFNNVSSHMDGASYKWYFSGENESSEDAQNPTYRFTSLGEQDVILEITDAQGCVDSVLKTVFIETDYAVYMPNVFTPNGDGVNDIFSPVAVIEGIQSFEMTIWNRLGERLFRTNDIEQGWNGHLNNSFSAPESTDGSYLYQVKVVDHLGKVRPQLTGEVILLR